MILEEWNTEDAIAFAREEGREDGREEVRREISELLAQGLTAEEIIERLEKITDGSAPVGGEARPCRVPAE